MLVALRPPLAVESMWSSPSSPPRAVRVCRYSNGQYLGALFSSCTL
jgi:hypothetical protein